MASRGAAIAAVALLASGCASSRERLPRLVGAHAVVASTASEEAPVARSPLLAWQQGISGTVVPPRARTVVYLRSHGRTVRVNPPGTYGATGGIDRGQLALQVVRNGAARLAVYRIAERRLVYLPRWVNDGSWLWKPDLDGDRLLYGAVLAGTKWPVRYQIRLADLRTHRVRVLVDLDTHSPYAAPGQLRGRWASWFTCVDDFCNVSRENLATGRIDSPPNPAERTHYQIAPAIDRRGVVYFERTSTDCAVTQIDRWSGGAVTRVLRLPAGTAYGNGYVDKASGRLYFDPSLCNRGSQRDVFATSARVAH